MRKIGFCLTLLGVCMISATSYADLAQATTSMAYGDPIQIVEHDDLGLPTDQQKGPFELTITNTGTIAWTDFHFGISFGSAIFDNPGGYPVMELNGNSIILDDEVMTDTTWDLYFDSNPVGQGDTVLFKVYTNNQANNGELFGICFWPTVPEPTTLAMLGLGSLTFLRKRK